MKLRSHIEIRHCRKICYIKMVVAPLIGMLEAYVKTLPLLSAFILWLNQVCSMHIKGAMTKNIKVVKI